ncbi:MAG: class I SAM-dependent methyltransferase [Burkholderiales bacterium]
MRLAGRKPRLSTTNPAKNSGCSEFEVDNWSLSRFVLARLIPVVGVEPFPLHELMLMCATVCRLKPTQIFEWGTHVGKSARVFYECAKHYAVPLQIHSVDLPDEAQHVEHPGDIRGRLVRGLAGIHLHQGDGIEVSLSVWRSSGRALAPVFFIDGDHAYDSVHRELSAVTAEIPGASVLLHDTFFQPKESGYNVGPHRAIEEVLRVNPGHYRRIDSGLGLPGMTLLYPRAS